MKKLSLFLIVSIILFSSCKKRTETVELIQGWFPWTGYLGVLYAVNVADSLYNLDFKIVDGADNIDPIQLVLADKYKFGVGGAEAIVAANVNTGADLVAIGVLNYKSPTCFISLPEHNISTLEDFQGKKIGILTGTETETIYRALKKKYNLNIDPKDEVEAPFDLQTFLLKRYDVRPGFTFDEVVTLDMQGIAYNVLYPEDYGITTVDAVFFTRRKTINENPELVQKIVNSLAEGWEMAFENPEEAVSLLKQHDPANIDVEREKACFMKGMEYFKGENDSVMYASDESWKNFENVLKMIDRVDENFDIGSSYDNSFIQNYFKQKNEKK